MSQLTGNKSAPVQKNRALVDHTRDERGHTEVILLVFYCCRFNDLTNNMCKFTTKAITFIRFIRRTIDMIPESIILNQDNHFLDVFWPF